MDGLPGIRVSVNQGLDDGVRFAQPVKLAHHAQESAFLPVDQVHFGGKELPVNLVLRVDVNVH